jgi:large subunit ribosomal protein L4
MKAPLTARYYKADGKAGSERKLPENLFDGVVNEASLYATVKAYLGNQRQGTASAKTRGEVRGGGRKPWRQKGTGRARVGSIRSPIWRGGAVVFPPKPRSYRDVVPKKVRWLARRSAFNARAAEGRVLIVEDLRIERPKTRQLVDLLEKLGVAGHKVLILTAGTQKTLYLSARNIPGVEVRQFGSESVYDVLWADSVIIEESALSEGESATVERSAATSSIEESGDA